MDEIVRDVSEVFGAVYCGVKKMSVEHDAYSVCAYRIVDGTYRVDIKCTTTKE